MRLFLSHLGHLVRTILQWKCGRGLLLALLLLISWYGAQPTEAQPSSDAQAEVIRQARDYVQKQFTPKVPGFAIAVGVNGKLSWSEAFGFRDLSAGLPVTTTTLFRVGSVSKALTSAGLALLVERGQLDLDAPVQKYVPDFPDKGAPITTRLLAGHLAGIRHYRGSEMLLNRPFESCHAALSLFQNDPLVAPPGSRFSYSTYGWTLISAVMESAAHEDFLRYMDESVIKRLGMTHTHAERKDVPDPDGTRFYQNEGAKFVVAPAVDNSYKWAGGGYLSTPEDLVRFGSALLQPGLLSAKSLHLLFTSQQTADGKPTGYGMGWFIRRDARGHRVFIHTGGSIGGTAFLLLHPETGTVVAFACNDSAEPFSKTDEEFIVELFAPLFTPVRPGR